MLQTESTAQAPARTGGFRARREKGHICDPSQAPCHSLISSMSAEHPPTSLAQSHPLHLSASFPSRTHTSLMLYTQMVPKSHKVLCHCCWCSSPLPARNTLWRTSPLFILLSSGLCGAPPLPGSLPASRAQGKWFLPRLSICQQPTHPRVNSVGLCPRHLECGLAHWQNVRKQNSTQHRPVAKTSLVQK